MNEEQKQLIREKFKSLKTLDGLDAEAVLAGDGTLLSEWIINELDLAIKQTEERIVSIIQKQINIHRQLEGEWTGINMTTGKTNTINPHGEKVEELENLITLIRNK